MANINNGDYEYNPIKEEINGKAAERTVWTTKALNLAVDGMKKGLPLKQNPFCGKNSMLLKPNLVYKRTKEELDDYVKCMEDPIYFASKCYLMSAEGGLMQVTLRDYQIDYINHLKENRFSIFLSCRQSGKSTTTAIYCLWVMLFNTDKNGLILSKSGPAGQDLLHKIKDMYLYLPYHLKIGTMKWNQNSISFDNNSQIATESFSPTAGLGKTINFLILDEFAWCNPNEVELFYNNIIPTVTTISDSNVCIMSTQNGFNLFYKLWTAAIKKKSVYAPFKVDWWQVPQWNPKTKKWERRTDAWKQEMIGVLGSEEDFYYQYGTMFSASDKCLVSRNTMKDLHENEILFDPIGDDVEIYLQYRENFFIKPDYDWHNFYNNFYVILVDLAEGGGGDYTVFNILEIKDEKHVEQVAYYHSNNVDLEHVSLEFWLLVSQLFNKGTIENCLYSIEWNTYGALFYNYLINLNDPEYMPEYRYRFNFSTFGIETSQVIQYKRGSMDQHVPGVADNRKTIPGIRFSGSNKVTACALLKMQLEKKNIIITDINTLSELENFEDKNGSGSYKAAYGHDDIIMTFCQVPMLQNTPRFKNFLEDITPYLSNSIQNNEQHYNPFVSNNMNFAKSNNMTQMF